MTDNSRSQSILLLVILSLIWGTSFILIKQGLKVYSADQVGALRVSSAALFLLPMALSNLRQLHSGHLWRLFASGMMGIFIPAFLFAFAQTRMASAVAGILNTLTPIFTLIIGAILFRQRFKALTYIGISLSFVGTLLLSFSRTDGALGDFNSYALFIVAASIFYASNLNFIKYKIPDLKATTITSISVLLIAPLALLYLFAATDFTERLVTHEGAWQALGFIGILGLMSTAVATIIFNRLVKISTPLFASSVTYILPIVAVGWGLLDGESLSTGHIIGMATILGGVYIANRK